MDPTVETETELDGVDFVALALGTTIGRYEILATLGQGGFGITYRARDTRLGREVAIKEYLPSALAIRHEGVSVMPRSTKVAGDFTWGRDRFVAEGQTLATLQRAPAIVRVFDYLEANGTAYIVMELLGGETLESHLQRTNHLPPGEVDRILWPLLDGLEQVHNAGFLHRDIKPANILLDAAGNPTLIDFGASRVAIAGRTAAMTAIFTPGYAAAEQFTSAKQGPWTDIYGLSATLYHAVTGQPPPSAFERMLDDGYKPLTKLLPEAISPGVLAGIDAGLALRATDRPQSIAGWRAIISQAGTGGGDPATVVLGKRPDPTATMMMPRAAITTPELAPVKRSASLWAGAAAVVLVVTGASYYFATSSLPKPTAPPPAPTSVATAADTDANKAQEAQAAAAAADERRKADEAAANQKAGDQQKAESRRKADADARQKAEEQQKADAEKAEVQRRAEADEALRRQIAEETRRQIEAERVEQKRLDEAARQKAEADAAAKRQADEEAKKKADTEAEAKRKLEGEDKKTAEANETALHLAPLDRQHIQAALTGLGFNTAGTDGAFGPRSREMIANWQKARNYAATGFLTGAQNQAMLREGAPAVSRFDDDQKKLEDERKKADDAKRKADDDAKARPVAGQPVSQQPISSATYDGTWAVVMTCPTEGTVRGYTWRYDIAVKNGSISGQFGSQGTPPWATIVGQIQSDGTASMNARGVTSNSDYNVGNIPAGSPISYTFTARFEATRGTGTRVQGRSCGFTFVKH
jgi:serine/threonine protein kinase/peptidoglycan hydrolase-like protein with peptidoglycan-binding domain